MAGQRAFCSMCRFLKRKKIPDYKLQSLQTRGREAMMELSELKKDGFKEYLETLMSGADNVFLYIHDRCRLHYYRDADQYRLNANGNGDGPPKKRVKKTSDKVEPPQIDLEPGSTSGSNTKEQEKLEPIRTISENGKPICYLCQEEMKYDNVLKIKGIRSLSKASRQRPDDKILRARLKELSKDEESQISVHQLCVLRYKTNPNKKERPQASVGIEEKPHEEFDYEKMCIICCGNASDEYMKKRAKRVAQKEISRIGEQSTARDTLLRYMSNTDAYDNVKARLEADVDLFAVKARYHRNCYSKITHQFQRKSPKPEMKKQEFYQAITDYIRSNPELKFYGINEFIESREDLKNNQDRPINKTLQKHLIEEFGNDYQVLNVSGYGLLVIRAEHLDEFNMEEWKIGQLKKLF